MNTILVTTTVTAALCGLGLTTYGQTFSEWFFQHRTRMKYLRLQAAALDVLEGTTRAGYEAAADGEEEAKHEEITVVAMDETWLTSLGTVRDLFRNNDVTKLVYHSAGIVIDRSDNYTAFFNTSLWLSNAEKEVLAFDLGWVKAEMKGLLNHFLNCITDGKMQMTDDERWVAIHEMYRNAVTAFGIQSRKIRRMEAVIAMRRQQDANDKYLKNLQP